LQELPPIQPPCWSHSEDALDMDSGSEEGRDRKNCMISAVRCYI
jgi:hypothetical protein